MTENELLAAIREAESEYVEARDAEMKHGSPETWHTLEHASERLKELESQLKLSREATCEHNLVPSNNATTLRCTRCGGTAPVEVAR